MDQAESETCFLQSVHEDLRFRNQSQDDQLSPMTRKQEGGTHSGAEVTQERKDDDASEKDLPTLEVKFIQRR